MTQILKALAERQREDAAAKAEALQRYQTLIRDGSGDRKALDQCMAALSLTAYDVERDALAWAEACSHLSRTLSASRLAELRAERDAEVREVVDEFRKLLHRAVDLLATGSPGDPVAQEVDLRALGYFFDQLSSALGDKPPFTIETRNRLFQKASAAQINHTQRERESRDHRARYEAIVASAPRVFGTAGWA